MSMDATESLARVEIEVARFIEVGGRAELEWDLHETLGSRFGWRMTEPLGPRLDFWRVTATAAAAGVQLGAIEVSRAWPGSGPNEAFLESLFNARPHGPERTIYFPTGHFRTLVLGELALLKAVQTLLAIARETESWPEDLINHERAAELLGCSAKTIKRRIHDGVLRAYGKRAMVSSDEVRRKAHLICHRRWNKPDRAKAREPVGGDRTKFKVDTSRTQGPNVDTRQGRALPR